MPMPEEFKFDVRVRERLQRKGQLTDSELEQRLDALPDLAANAVDIELKQPALQTEAERAENSVIVRPAPPRPVIAAPIPIEDEEEEEEEVKPVRAAAPAGAAPVAVKAKAEDAEAAADDDEDDDDDDDDAR
jgi:hypothetical protein